MITFENITQTKSVYTHFLPILLIPLALFKKGRHSI